MLTTKEGHSSRQLLDLNLKRRIRGEISLDENLSASEQALKNRESELAEVQRIAKVGGVVVELPPAPCPPDGFGRPTRVALDSVGIAAPMGSRRQATASARVTSSTRSAVRIHVATMIPWSMSIETLPHFTPPYEPESNSVGASRAEGRSLLRTLPLTIEMRDHLRQEKTGNLTDRLRHVTSKSANFSVTVLARSLVLSQCRQTLSANGCSSATMASNSVRSWKNVLSASTDPHRHAPLALVMSLMSL
jgi:hypothetical protein